MVLNAQKGVIEGTIRDSLKSSPVEFASIRLLHKLDSSYVKGTSSNENGRFKLQQVANGHYIAEISYLGYKTWRREIPVTPDKSTYNLGTIFLQEDINLLDEAVVTAQVPDIVVKGDTIEYNAGAYMSEENALLQDILKNIPGIEIDSDGNLKANGKPVNKILVDGKEFFDNDIQMALKNLPANMIKKLQLFKEQSEASKLTGFKDGKEQQVLNLKVKDEFKQSFLGDIKVGYGNNDKYSNKVTLNYMHGDNQLSAIGNINNVSNDSEYSNIYSPYAGIDKNKNIGVNFNREKSKDFRIGGNVRYSDNENIFESLSNTENFLPDGNRLSTQNSSTTNNRRNLNMGVNLMWKPDTLTTIYFRGSGAYNKNRDNRGSESLSYVSGKDSTKGWSDYNSTGEGKTINGSLAIGRRLNSKGRNISLNLNGNFRKDNSNGTNKSLTTYSSDIEDKVIDQRLNTDNKSSNWGVSVSYVEPITSKNSIMLSYSYRQNDYDRIKDTYRKDDAGNYTIIDTAYTRRTVNFYANQSISLTFQSILEKFEYSIGFNIDPSYSRSKVSIGDSIIDNPNSRQKVVNFSPSLRFTYKPKENTSLEVNYNGSTSHPNLTQLSADTIILNALSKTYGNPDLKPSYSNNLNMYFHKSDYESGKYLMAMAGFGYTINQIVDYTRIDSLGNTETTYKNVNGNWNANIGILFNTPLKNKKFTIDTNTNANFYRNIGFSNGEKSVTNNLSIGEYLSLNFRSDKFESRLNLNYTYSLTKNNLTNQQDLKASNYGFGNSSTLKLPWDITIKNDISYKYNSGYPSEFKKTEVLWNASLSKLFLRKKMGTLRIQFYDILKDRNNVTRTVSGNYVSDMRTNMISRYFMVSFTYRFNIARGGSKPDDDYDIMY